MRLVMLLIGLVFGATFGFLLAGGLGPSMHDHTDHAGAGHDHDAPVDWPVDRPALQPTVTLTPDTVSGYNLTVSAPGFVYAPDAVGAQTVTPGQGHTHVYVNGVKVTRLYGPAAHLPDTVAGDTVRVTFNADNHAHYAIAGTPIAAEVVAP